ncbi:MAG TPA: PAS domain S-box protein [Polyangiales bacterium]|nr:PAS domain S-box protein [Polyangiales bacterium]
MSSLADKLLLAIDSARVGTWEWEIASARVIWSEHVERMFGLAPRSFGGTFEHYQSLVHPDDLPSMLDAIKLSFGSVSNAYEIEHRVCWPDGSIHWIEGRGSLHRDADGKPLRMTGTVVDITARKQAEAELRSANQALHASEAVLRQFIKHSPAAVAMFDTEMRYLHVAERWLTDYRLEGRDIIGKSHYEIFPDLPEEWKEVHRRVLSGSIERCDEAMFPRTDGKVDWLQWEVRPWRKAGGEIGGLIMFTQMITERKRVEAEVRALQEQKRQAQKLEALGTLAGGIAHDFNNILGAIVAFTEAAKFDRADDPGLHEHLDQVLKASSRATELVRQILSFSRQQPQERKPTQLARVVAEALALLRATLPSTIEIAQELASDLPDTLVDAGQMHQVIMNLATNAAHAMRGRGQLRVTLDRFALAPGAAGPHPELRPGEYLRLVTSDTGHGMDEVTRHRIFDPFFTTKPTGEGTGLGLAVVHGIVSEYGGVITVSSEPGKGASFEIYLPALQASEGAQRAAPQPEASAAGKRVLFVDDEQVLCRAAHLMLKRAGYVPITCVSSEEAWKAFERDPDALAAVVTDLTMPGMTGIELASKITALRPKLPVILASGHLDPRTASLTARAGVRQVIEKPFDYLQLASALADALRESN